MEVVEAAAAQLETLKFNGAGCGGGQGEEARAESSAAAPGPRQRPPSEEARPDTGQVAGPQPAGERPLHVRPSAADGGVPEPRARPEPPSGGSCVAGPGAAEPARTPYSLETSGSDSDSDRSGACRSWSRGERARGPGAGRGEAAGARCARGDTQLARTARASRFTTDGVVNLSLVVTSLLP